MPKASLQNNESEFDITNLVNTSSFSIQKLESANYHEIVTKARQQLRECGCAILRSFVWPSVLKHSRQQAAKLASEAHFHKDYVNPYSSDDDPTLPRDHPVRLFMERSSAFVAKDKIPTSYPLRQLYHHSYFKQFIADCLEEEEIYEYEDPLAGFVINVIQPEHQQEWHYDTNEFIVTMMTQSASQGGQFLYCPNIRSPEFENYDAVRDVILGRDTSPVKVLDIQPGDLQIFRGRYSLHRVTRVKGSVERHTSIFAYAKQPGVVGQLDRTLKLYGKAYPIHYERENSRPKQDQLLG